MDENLQQLQQELGAQLIDEGAMEAVQEIMAEGVTPDELAPVMEMLQVVLQNPEAYPEIRAQLIAQDFLDEEDLPFEFDPDEIGTLFLVLSRAIEMLSGEGGAQTGMPPEMMAQPQMPPEMMQMPPEMAPQQFAMGGLAKIQNDLASMGRNGDTMVAHINPTEARLLKRLGGSGTINPNTGLPEFFFKKVFKAVKNTVKSVANVSKKVVGKVTSALGPGATGLLLAAAAPWAIPAIGGALGTGALVSGALYGGATSALTGGNVAQGALLGGLGGGLGEAVGGYANNALGLGLGDTGRQLLGSSLVGGAAGAATGQGFLAGAAQGALGQQVGSAIQGLGTGLSGAAQSAVQQGGKQFGNMLTAGFDPKSAALTGGLSGIASALTYQQPDVFRGIQKPSDSVVEGLKQPQLMGESSDFGNLGEDLLGQPSFRQGTGVDYSLASGQNQMGQTPNGTQMSVNMPQMQTPMGQAAQAAPTGGGIFDGNNLLKYGSIAALGSSLLSKPPEVQQQIQQLSPEKQAYFNRPSVSWDWSRIMSDANQEGRTLADYVSANWPRITSGQYNSQASGQMGAGQMPQVQMAQGGALDSISRYMRGGGSGRSDKIDAKLSPGEYVFDAETVALLGDGSSEEGGKRLESMRQQVRKHKGKELAKGKFSRDAKSPLDYIKGAL